VGPPDELVKILENPVGFISCGLYYTKVALALKMPIATGGCFRQALFLSPHRDYLSNITSKVRAGAKPQGKTRFLSFPPCRS